MSEQVLLASVPCVHLASAETVSSLMKRVAFGTSYQGIINVPIGLPVYIFASQPPHRLFDPGRVSWAGKLGAIVPANEKGRRSGKHHDPSVRPPSTEALIDGDGLFLFFWEVEDLHQLEMQDRVSLSKFKSSFHGGVPQWPVLAQLD